ncbi:LysR family transcriptional regulator [Kribbella antibiotica]|uniref:LysR family transcriptional regulator n=1 Tax=Kribbella antibiotica TaxID=190195 RepID=A0A4R4ZGP8_9ACTN|nr:LysR family transcriptional regulator [Kribbella antibiotica]TDD57713.1 LysR family transcriptional regulator [Kribbella antibiotica]
MDQLRPDFIDDLRRLRVLREFRERGTVTATADALHLTPSAVSQQLAGLSRDLGFAVIEREGRRVKLTPRGTALLHHGDAVFARLEQARLEFQSWDRTIQGNVTIGAPSSALISLLPRALSTIRAELPKLNVSLRQLEPPALFDLLDAGKVDLAIAVSFDGSPSAGDARYHRVELGADVLDVALSATHPLAAEEEIELPALQHEPWISGTLGGCCATITSTACAAAGFAPRIAYQVDDWHAVAQLIRQGHAVGLLPRLVQESMSQELAIRPVKGPRPQRHLFAAVREGSQQSPLMTSLLTTIRRSALDGERAA